MRGLLRGTKYLAAQIQEEICETHATMKELFGMMLISEKLGMEDNVHGWPMYQNQKHMLMALDEHLKKGGASDCIDYSFELYKKECMDTIDGLMFPDDEKVPMCFGSHDEPPTTNDEAVRRLTENIKQNYEKMEALCTTCKAVRSELEARLTKRAPTPAPAHTHAHTSTPAPAPAPGL